MVFEPEIRRRLNKNKEGLHPELEWCLSSKLDEDKKKVFTQNWSGFCARKVYCIVQKYVCAQ